MARVTILMPAYNVEKYIKESIESILNQTFKDFVLLILDDCSTDKTASIVASFTDARIKYVKHEHNLGLADNLNRGIELADTEFLARMDGDDISTPTCLEKQINFLDSHPEIGVCSVGFQFFGTKTSKVIFPEYHEDIKAEQLFGNSVILPMLRRSVFIDNQLRYKTTAFPAEDYRMWAETIRVTQVYNMQEIMFHYRMHPDQISTEKRKAQIQKTNAVRLYMLEWLSPELNIDEKKYFIDEFVPGLITNKKDLKKLLAFSELLIKHNNKFNNFDNFALKNRFENHISFSVYNFALSSFFQNGYSILKYMKFILSGTALHLNKKLLFKMFLKAILHRSK